MKRLLQYEEDFVENYLSNPKDLVGEMETLHHADIPDIKTDESLAKMLYQVTLKCPKAAGDVTKAQEIVS